MKIIGVFSVVMTVSMALLQPAQGGSRGSGRGSFSAPHYSGGNVASQGRNFSGGGARFHSSSPRFSSRGSFQNRATLNPRNFSRSGPRFSSDRAAALNPGVYSRSSSRFAGNRTTALNSRASANFNPQGRIVARHGANQHPNWDRGRDHFWRGHRCHWHNNTWVIFDPWIYPFNYGFGYPYGAYPYYDGGYYDDSSYPAQAEYDSGYADSSLSQVQAALAKEGYYHGAIDGSLGPETRAGLRRYQRDHGLRVTGRADGQVIEALGLR